MARHARYDRKTALEKAVGLFWEKGYHGSSMKQIEQALDMRPGSIYATFGSKDGLFSEALAPMRNRAAGSWPFTSRVLIPLLTAFRTICAASPAVAATEARHPHEPA